MQFKKCKKCLIEKGIAGFYKDKSRPDGFSDRCKLCKKAGRSLESNRKYYYKKREYYQDYRKRTQDFVRKCKRDFGCYFCKEVNEVCLDFHHVEEKKWDITKVNSVKAITEEMKKCICVCCNCHRKIHAGMLAISDDWKEKANKKVDEAYKFYEENKDHIQFTR